MWQENYDKVKRLVMLYELESCAVNKKNGTENKCSGDKNTKIDV